MTSKKPDLIVKDGVKVEEKDYRGVLALILVSAWIIFLALGRTDAAVAVGPFAGSAVTWWFNRRRKGGGFESYELRKNWRARLSGGLVISALVVLLDEIVKEGYVFDISDVFAASITHEKVFLILLSLGIIFGWRRRRK